MIFNNIKEYFFYLGQQDKKNKRKIRKILDLKTKLSQDIKKEYRKGFKKRGKK